MRAESARRKAGQTFQRRECNQRAKRIISSNAFPRCEPRKLDSQRSLHLRLHRRVDGNESGNGNPGEGSYSQSDVSLKSEGRSSTALKVREETGSRAASPAMGAGNRAHATAANQLLTCPPFSQKSSKAFPHCPPTIHDEDSWSAYYVP